MKSLVHIQTKIFADVLSKALKEIEQIMPNIEVKPAAIEALKQLSSQIKTQINETNEATLEEKDEAINQLEEALKIVLTL